MERIEGKIKRWREKEGGMRGENKGGQTRKVRERTACGGLRKICEYELKGKGK